MDKLNHGIQISSQPDKGTKVTLDLGAGNWMWNKRDSLPFKIVRFADGL